MFFKLLSFVLMFHIFMSNVYPEEEIKLLMNFSYFCIYAYTFLEIKVKQLYLQIINDNPGLLEFMKYISKKSGEDNIEIISDNQVINTCNYNNSNWYQIIPNYCKFIIYSDPEPQTSTITNKIIKILKINYLIMTFVIIPLFRLIYIFKMN